MKKFLSVLFLGVTAFVSSAHANNMLSSGFVFGGATQNQAVCFITNTSLRPQKLAKVEIRVLDAESNYGVAASGCANTLVKPGEFCSVGPVGLHLFAYNCTARPGAGVSADDFRGNMGFRDSDLNVLNIVPLR